MNAMGNPPLAGRYVLIDQIGAGGMGSVWRAWDLKNHAFVAAKLLGQHDSGMLLRFVREQSVRIQHPHVVAPSGWAAEDNLVIFTMDLVKGGSVQTLLGDHGPLPEEYVAVLLDQSLQALEAVHNAGVVHRDVKPANLMLEPTGTARPHIRLGDFGVAALIDEVRLTRFPGAIGTDGYMAPEQAHGAAPEPQQDLYALGVVGIQMLTGLSPRNQKGAPEGKYHDFLTMLTDEDSQKRPASASIALQQLREIGVPPGAPWQKRDEPPEVFNQLTEVPPPSQVPPGSHLPSHPGFTSGGGFAPHPGPQGQPGQPGRQGGPGMAGPPHQSRPHSSPWGPPPSHASQGGNRPPQQPPFSGSGSGARSGTGSAAGSGASGSHGGPGGQVFASPGFMGPQGVQSGGPSGGQPGPGSNGPRSGAGPASHRGRGAPSYGGHQQGPQSHGGGSQRNPAQRNPAQGSPAQGARSDGPQSQGGQRAGSRAGARAATGSGAASPVNLYGAIACFVLAAVLAVIAVLLML